MIVAVFTEPEFVGAFPPRKEVTTADRVEPCPVCGENVIEWGLVRHCRQKGDLDHLALEVMET